MAHRGTVKSLSITHEEHVAKKFHGTRSKTSQKDVRVEAEDTIFECKGRWGARVGAKDPYTLLIRQMEKVFDEAASEGKEPAIAMRFFLPDSPLADDSGYVDFAVRLLEDDAFRSEFLREYREEHRGSQA